MEDSTAWSDDSSTDVSFDTRRQSDASMESYPVFVRSASDDLTDFAENSTVSIDRASPGKPNNKPGPSPLALTTLSVDHHERRPFLLAKRAAPNHYFREKKWDFFPELATPSELPSGYPNFPSNTRKQNSSRLNLSALDFTKKGSRWTASEKRTRTHDMRNSIRSYVQRRLSKHSVDKDKPKRRPRPSTAPSEFRENLRSSRKTASSNYSNYSDHGSIGSQENFLDLSDMKRLSVSTHSSVDENQKQLESMAFHIKEQQNVTIAPIQKHGSALWEKPGREKRISYRQKSNVRFPRYQKRTSSFRLDLNSRDPPPACSPLHQSTRLCVRALQDGTSYVLIALDGARQRIIQAQVDRRRRHLKSKIKLIGPVNPYTTYGRVDPWI
jgi:hypothetical protein